MANKNKKKSNKEEPYNTTKYKDTLYYEKYLIDIKELAIKLKENGYYNFKGSIFKFDIVRQRFVYNDEEVYNRVIPGLNVYQNMPLNWEVKNLIINELNEIPNPKIWNTLKNSTIPEQHITDFKTLKNRLFEDGLIK